MKQEFLNIKQNQTEFLNIKQNQTKSSWISSKTGTEFLVNKQSGTEYQIQEQELTQRTKHKQRHVKLTRCINHEQRIFKEEKKAKEHMIFDHAMNTIKDVHWKSVKFARRKVTVEVEPSGARPHPYGQDFQEVKEVIGGSARRLRQSTFNDEFMFLVKHMDKRIGTIILTKCDEATCSHKCWTLPIIQFSPLP